MDIDQLDTPVAVVDLDVLDGNIDRLQRQLDACGLANRPHIKTHKIPAIAQMQLAAGAVGIACQKLGEAEVMVDGGITDIFIPYNLLGQAKLERLVSLCRRARISVSADSATTAGGLSAAMQAARLELPVLVEFDSGQNRCGVQSPQEAAELARTIARSPGLRFAGLMTYPTRPNLAAFVTATRELLRADGLPVEIVSGGGSAEAWQIQRDSGATEHRAGTYVYADRYGMKTGYATQEQVALRVLATVVSRPTATRAILDAGSKALSSDLLGMEGHGLIVEYPDAIINKLSEEHGHVELGARGPQIGERVSIIPNHACVVTNLFNEIVGMRGGRVEVVWPVAARGLLR